MRFDKSGNPETLTNGKNWNVASQSWDPGYGMNSYREWQTPNPNFDSGNIRGDENSPGSSLAQLLQGQGAPIGALNLSSAPSADLTSWASSQAPRQQLQGYSGNTNVDMSPETSAMLAQILQFAQSPQLQQLLSGRTDQGLFEAGVVNPMQRDFRNTVLPGINDAYTGGGYGSGFWSGARQKAGGEAQNKLQEQIAGLRYQDYNNAQDRSIQAAGLMPGMAQALSLRETLAGQNMDRGINTNYQNQLLKSQQYQDDMNFVNSLLGAQQNSNQLAVQQQGQQISQAGDIRANQLSLQDMLQRLQIAQMNNSTNQQGNALNYQSSLNKLNADANRPQTPLEQSQTTNMNLQNMLGQLYLQSKQSANAPANTAEVSRTGYKITNGKLNYPG